MAGGRKILVIIDATHEQHLALERMIITCEVKEPGAHIHLFISVDSENTDLGSENANLYRDDTWLNPLRTNLTRPG